MPESTEAQIARLDERLKSILTIMKDAREGQRHQQEWMTVVNQTLITIGGRVENVENNLARASPTIDEFITIKHKVIGAGILGKWIWGGLGLLIGVVYSMREAIFTWVAK